MTMRRTSVLCLLASCALAVPAVAQQPTTAPADTVPAVVLKTYDIGDLVRPTQNYPITPEKPEGGLWNGGSPPPPPAKLSAEFVGSMLTDLIAVDTWKVNGGALGSVQALPTQTALLVQQTEANHRAIAAMLAEVREQQGVRTMVSTRAQWVMLDDAQVRAIYERARRERVEGATLAPPIVDDGIIEHAKVYCRGQSVCFNGQTVSIASAREWSVVTDLNPVVGTGAVGYDAETARASSGVTLQITPQLMPDTSSVVLDLRSVVTETRVPAGGGIDLAALGRAAASTTQPVAVGGGIGGAEANAMIDRQDVVRQSFATTVRLPLGKRVLVSGMTLEPTAEAKGEARQLYLVVEVDSMK